MPPAQIVYMEERQKNQMAHSKAVVDIGIKKMKKEKLSKLRSLQDKINRRLKDIEPLREELDELKKEKRYEELSKLIGRCFKYKNRYSGDDTWWLYIKVTGINDYGVDVITCEKDCYGKITIEKDRSTTSILENKIRPSTFEKILKKLMSEIK
jgi:hypothetical protein